MLEQTITLLTIKWTMMCFFLTVFSVPFWIATTYKPYLSEIEPFAQAFNTIWEDLGDESYFWTLENFKTI